MLNTMIKPYTILKTTEVEVGTMIEFSISTRHISEREDGGGTHNIITKAAILVPTGEDIDNYLLDYLIKNNWITQ